VIIRAYDNTRINPEHKTSDVFAVNVLKTLFMIKYILEIEANIDNITSLMISSIDDDRIELKGKVEAALTDSGIPTRETVFYAGSSSDYQWLFLQMVRELQTKQQGYEEILRMNLRHLCLLIGRHRTAEQTPDEKTLGEIESAIRFFGVRYYQNFDIKAYAKQHWMTPHWFAQNFKKATGASPKQYIIALRIANAKHLLDNTSDTIAQIAAAVGYENTPYFHRLFHKQTGMTPLEYRHRPR
jgi:YesN/AraC family two-component response regulator